MKYFLDLLPHLLFAVLKEPKFFANEGREGYVGTSEEELSLIVTDPDHLDKQGVQANFYVDTEFGYGTGGINTRGMSFGDIWAVYTPTHFIPMHPEVHEIW